MSERHAIRVGYVVKRYPRFSETFILNELLAHQAAGLPFEVFALRPPNDTHFQNQISRVQAPVRYVPHQHVRAGLFWSIFEKAAGQLPRFWETVPTLLPVSGDDLNQAIHLALAVRTNRIDHLHAHFGSLATTVTRLAARLAQVPYTFTAHAKDIFHDSVQRDDLATKVNDAAAVVTVSQFNVAYLRGELGNAAKRVVRIYNGLDFEEFVFRSPAERPRRIVAVGRLVEKKGFADLVAACAILARRKVDFHCDIIGVGDQQHELDAQIEQLNLRSRVSLVGARPQSEVIASLHNAAALAVPCVVGQDGNRDGLPTVLLEAMALGTPCVATPVTGIPEVVCNEQTGLLVRGNDPQQLAVALTRLLDDATLRVALAKRARRQIEQSFDVHRNAAVLRDVFRKANPRTRSGHVLQEAG